MRLLFGWHLSMLVLRSVTSFISYLQSALSATSQEQSKQSQRGWAQVKSTTTSADLNIFGSWCDPNRSQVSWFSPDIFSHSEPCGSFGLLVLEISDSEGQPTSEHLAASCSCSPLRQVYPWIPAPSLEQSWKGLWPEGRKGHLTVFYGSITFVCKGSLAWGLLVR